jgi:SNF2 family DNA or RNA helicase
MISKQGRDNFRHRKLQDSSKSKSLPESKLDSMLADREFFYEMEPRYAQKICLLLGWKYDSYLFLMGTGGGKTKLTLDLFRNKKDIGKASRMLVLIPNVVNLREWELQVGMHGPELKVALLDQSGSGARLQTLFGQADVVVATYAGLNKLCTRTEMNSKGKNKWVVDAGKVKRIAEQFDFLVLDESTSLKNPDGLPFRVIKRFRRYMTCVYALTGTPFDKSPIDLWSQFYLIDSGHTLGETVGLFREVFFRRVDNYFGCKWVFRKQMESDLARRLSHCSIRFAETECQDLPESIGGVRNEWMFLPVDLPKEQRPYYDSFSKDLNDSKGDYSLCESAYTRMRMVSSGWVGLNGEEDAKVELVFKKNPKLDVVIAKALEIMESGESVLIIHWFNVTGKLIQERLKKEKMKHLWVYGKTPNAKKGRALDEFKASKEPMVLLASTAISKGVNLQDAARFTIFMESPDSLIERKQLEARTNREGKSTLPRYFWDAICRGTKDEALLDSLKSGERLLDKIVDGQRVER